MINPFVPFTKPLLDAFVRAGEKYFIRQSFPRAKDHFDKGIKGYFIYTHYADIAHAQHHLSAISHDPYRRLYEWDNPEHQEKLKFAATKPTDYKIFSAVLVKDWEEQLSSNLKGKVRNFVENKIGWKPSRSDTLDFKIYLHYGELYAKLKLQGEEVRVKLEDIENF